MDEVTITRNICKKSSMVYPSLWIMRPINLEAALPRMSILTNIIHQPVGTFTSQIFPGHLTPKKNCSNKANPFSTHHTTATLFELGKKTGP